MKLSEAILLGDTLKKCEPGCFISPDGSCGCAIGGALLATGADPAEVDYQLSESCDGISGVSEIEAIKSRWPWLTWRHIADISLLYNKVAAGEMTIEQVAAFVRTIEPPDPEPEPFPVDDEQPEVRA